MPVGAASAAQRGASYQPSTIVGLWVNQVVANGGTVSAGRRTLVTTLVAGYLANGSFYAKDDIVMLVAENTQSALTSWKQRRLAIAVNSPIFTTDRGYLFDGLTNYINTQAVASTSVGSMSPTDLRLAVYSRTAIAIARPAIGILGSLTNENLVIRPNSAATIFVVLDSTPATTNTIVTSLGYTTGSRASGSAAVNIWKNGAAQAGGTATTVNNTTLPAFAFYIGGRNNQGTADQLLAASIGCVEWGAPETSGQESGDYTLLQAFMTAVGANV